MLALHYIYTANKSYDTPFFCYYSAPVETKCSNSIASIVSVFWPFRQPKQQACNHFIIYCIQKEEKQSSALFPQRKQHVLCRFPRVRGTSARPSFVTLRDTFVVVGRNEALPI